MCAFDRFIVWILIFISVIENNFVIQKKWKNLDFNIDVNRIGFPRIDNIIFSIFIINGMLRILKKKNFVKKIQWLIVRLKD